MDDFKERLESERKELEDKHKKLNQFLGTEKSKDIDNNQLTLLLIQEKAMATYLQCLEARLASL